MSKITYECLCKTVGYELTTTPEFAANCHCTSCNVYGGDCARVGGWKPDQFKITKGEENIIRYESAPKKWRQSCKTCGSFIHNTLPDGLIVIPLGGLKYPDGVEKVAPSMNIFTAEAVRPVDEGLKNFEGWPQ